MPKSDHPISVLPTELQIAITEHLDYPAAIQLRATSRYFRNLIIPPILAQLRQQYAAQLFEFEQVREEQRQRRQHGQCCDGRRTEQPDTFACYMCLHLRPASCFTEPQVSRRRKKNDVTSNGRVCLECSAKVRSNMHIADDGRDLVLCWKCDKVKTSCGRISFTCFCEDCYIETPEGRLEDMYRVQKLMTGLSGAVTWAY